MQDIAACLVNRISLSTTSEGMLLLHCKASRSLLVPVCPSSQWAARSSALSMQVKLCPQAALAMPAGGNEQGLEIDLRQPSLWRFAANTAMILSCLAATPFPMVRGTLCCQPDVQVTAA